jgi:hypothetical protein
MSKGRGNRIRIKEKLPRADDSCHFSLSYMLIDEYDIHYRTLRGKVFRIILANWFRYCLKFLRSEKMQTVLLVKTIVLGKVNTRSR